MLVGGRLRYFSDILNFKMIFIFGLMLVLLGSCHNVYIGVTKPSKDFLHQDGRRLANIQPHDSIL